MMPVTEILNRINRKYSMFIIKPFSFYQTTNVTAITCWTSVVAACNFLSNGMATKFGETARIAG